MFETAKAFGSFAVADLAAAQTFYDAGHAGLRGGRRAHVYLTGDHRILIYHKLDHSPASFTILNFPVDDIDEAVDELTTRGVDPALRGL